MNFFLKKKGKFIGVLGPRFWRGEDSFSGLVKVKGRWDFWKWVDLKFV
jgi:hypothetical protein